MHYIIGDVHGHSQTLLALMRQLPEDANVIFVGDLVDRGRESADVVRFVREGGYPCVMGNHEEMMCSYGEEIVSAYENGTPLPQYNTWYSNGGVATLRSYGIVKIVEGKLAKVEDFDNPLQRFKDDIKWMKTLPLYIELDTEHYSEKPAVVSHAPIATAWNLRHMESRKDEFRHRALTDRQNPAENAPIFNIFGHTPRAHGPDIKDHYINVDTGCYIDDGTGYGKLCAYCVESGEVVCQENIG